MRYGVCGGPERADALARIGYDFIELSVADHLMADQDEAAWPGTRDKLKSLPLPPETFNSFVRTGKIVGPDADADALRRYVHTALERAASIGGKIIVFGSGGARNVPESFGADRAQEQLRAFLNLCAEASAQTGVVVVIEPLRKAESNLIHLVSEGAQLAREVGRAGVRALGDTYHMVQEGEPVAALVAARDVLAHVHVADDGRLAPGTGAYDYVSLFGALRDAGYDQRIGIECSWGADFAGEAERALHALKAAHAAANNGDLESTSG